MNDIVLSVRGISKTMGGRLIIDNISFDTYGGEVFGFLGPNGAGKTTTIKMILGLLDIDEGEVEICGINVRKQFEKALLRAGGIVENPETYHFLTGLQNLRQYQRIRPGVTDERVAEVVRMVGLEKRIKDKVRKYSLGMRQRLGLAQALLHRPRLLILDEPTNGLDPAGIRELRDILKYLAHEEGISVLVSSHLLSEMELMCDRVGIIVNGRVTSIKTTDALSKQAAGEGRMVRFTVGDVAAAVATLEKTGNTPVHQTERTFELAAEDDAAIAAISAALVQAGIALTGIAPIERSLEDAFLELTGGGGDQIA